MIRERITICGRVQGVGCRPFVFRLAQEAGLCGYVRNDTQGVFIEVQGSKAAIEKFKSQLLDCQNPAYPPLLKIVSLTVCPLDPVSGENGFSIADSDPAGTPASQVTPDCAVCKACLNEMNNPADRRYRYPFINCTHCGPRYSIVRAIPYDRANTTMDAFSMCSVCRRQYADVLDRRFHAQPVACPVCGPAIRLTDADGNTIEADSDKAIARCAEILLRGGIAAIKGLGGYHLAADAHNERAVSELRRRKRRDAKPFALMAASVETVSCYAIVDPLSRQLLESPQAPIVLLDKIQPNALAPSVANGLHRLGFMLCYTPLHYLLFAQPGIAVLVMTSANLSDEPLICKDQQALDELGGIADVFLMHNREIYRPIDDSVLHTVNNQPAFLRRARGYVPAPVFRSKPASKDIFAAGGDLKNTICFVKGNQYLVSEHIGDLADAKVFRHYVRSIEHLQQLFDVRPQAAVCDLHPGYLSSQFAQQAGIPLLRVQHHWAHIASVLADCNEQGPVIGLAADGTGYGTDGAVWGCECLIASLTEFERFGHLAYYPLAGGDKAAQEAIRPLVGLLAPDGNFGCLTEYMDILNRIEPDVEKIHLICLQIQKRLNTVATSSLGRLFDAAAALAGAGAVNRYEAQLPMHLEAMTARGAEEGYPVQLDSEGAQICLSPAPIIKAMIKDIRDGMDASVIAARFQNAVCEGLLQMAFCARQKRQLNTVALSGGVFCNRYLANRLIVRLQQEQFRVLWKQSVPVSDGGISLGQAAIAAEMLDKGKGW
ncbi:MAG TPA: carbamoyltransferase HypF [Anaerohalosphaeraceae bacterium]|mgnify:FL=1|nr:carbamoyltransferase HypF [Anaerohalosphaeraceae bacterium]